MKKMTGKIMIRLSAFLLVVLLGIGVYSLFADGDHLPEAYSELVMPQQSHLSVEGDGGPLRIEAGKNLWRTYSWADCSYTVNLFAREKRWNGSLGAYDTGAKGGLNFLREKPCEGISRMVVEEGQLHFATYKQVHLWLTRQPEAFQSYWTSDGLFVRMARLEDIAQVNIDLFQLCIDGKRATTFWKASDERFKWLPSNVRHNCADVGKEGLIQENEDGTLSTLSLKPLK